MMPTPYTVYMSDYRSYDEMEPEERLHQEKTVQEMSANQDREALSWVSKNDHPNRNRPFRPLEAKKKLKREKRK